jgi:HK97 family phage prohead protease
MSTTLSRPQTRQVNAEFVTARATPTGGKRYKFRASSTKPARDGYVIPASEWRLDEYKKNSVVLWAHDYSSAPIGRAVDLHTDPDGLVAEIEFDLQDPRGAEVARKIDDGFLSAMSVGFRPNGTDPGSRGAPPRFLDVTLLELSIVPVPSDADALLMRGLRGRNQQQEFIDRIATKVARMHSQAVMRSDVRQALEIVRQMRREQGGR